MSFELLRKGDKVELSGRSWHRREIVTIARDQDDPRYVYFVEKEPDFRWNIYTAGWEITLVQPAERFFVVHGDLDTYHEDHWGIYDRVTDSVAWFVITPYYELIKTIEEYDEETLLGFVYEKVGM